MKLVDAGEHLSARMLEDEETSALYLRIAENGSGMSPVWHKMLSDGFHLLDDTETHRLENAYKIMSSITYKGY